MSKRKRRTIAVDCRILSAPPGGSAFYTRHVLKALAKLGVRDDYALIQGPGAQNGQTIRSPRFRDVMVDDASLCDERWEQWQMPSQLTELGADLLLAPTMVLPALRSCPCVQVIYDLGFEVHASFYTPELRRYLRKWVRLSARNADHIVTLSEHARSEITSIYCVPDEKITTIPGAPAAHFAPARRDDIEATLRRHRISRPYVLSVASAERNKNLPALIEAFSTACLGAKGGWQLVLTGRAGGGEREIREALGRNGIEDRVVMTGFVPDEDLPALYSGSEIFAFPSLYEGFGLPPVEALACGTAVLCSNAASLPEVVGDAGLLADPTPESFAD
ncbi:MAG TPA: glycosyltransferase family 1 protein, partial [Armatimonadota bacterium]|nr:glycosyltransferase family 1 protein [Armatimonadota bacterium]